MILLSLTGVLRTILIIVGVIVIARFIGNLMIAKRNVDEQRRMKEDQVRQDKMVEEAKKNYGKTSLTNFKDDPKSGEFVDFEEIDD